MNYKEKKGCNKYLALFVTFLKASTFTFAGGLAVVPAIEKDAVEKYHLLNKEDFLEYATLSQTMPGVIALNCATLVGRHSAGFLGMVAAGIGAIFPAFFFMILATILVDKIPKNGPILGAVKGIRAASAALLFSAAFSLGKYNLKNISSVIIAILAFLLVYIIGINAPVIIVLFGFWGCVKQRIFRCKSRRKHNVN